MRSDTVKKGFTKAPQRALLRACGLRDQDMNKPFIGIANSYCEIVPGHVHLNEVARIVKEAVRLAGGLPSSSIRSRFVTESPWAIPA